MHLLVIFPLANNYLSIYFASFALGFICGSIPFGYIISRIKGVDIRNYGSKNIGFTNVFRTLGLIYSIPVLILDILKGFLPTFFACRLELIAPIVALGTILGHILTPWLKFQGGKGVATTLGAMLALIPWSILISLSIFIIVLSVFSYVSLASLTFAVTLPITVSLIYSQSKSLITITIIISLFIIIRHIGNIKRLIDRTEPKFYYSNFFRRIK